jgi:ribosomal protein S18 acetylase RimI-like enzyme
LQARSTPIAANRRTPAFTVGPAAREEWPAALRLLFERLPPPQGELRAGNALRLLEGGAIEPEGVLVARAGGELVGCFVCQPLRGAGGLVWPPGARDGPGRAAVEDGLIEAGLAWLRGRGARLAEAFAPPREAHAAAPLTRHGFRHVTTLLYLRLDLDDPEESLPALPSPDRALRYTPFDRVPAPLFEATLVRSYEGTRDCPELNGVRQVGEIIEGHKAQGGFDPARWWLVCDGDTPAGVLLLTELEPAAGLDIAYLGVVPEARGRGVGAQLTAHAVRSAQAAGAPQLTLAVDARNEPARRMYGRLGFTQFDEREVFRAYCPLSAPRPAGHGGAGAARLAGPTRRQLTGPPLHAASSAPPLPVNTLSTDLRTRPPPGPAAPGGQMHEVGMVRGPPRPRGAGADNSSLAQRRPSLRIVRPESATSPRGRRGRTAYPRLPPARTGTDTRCYKPPSRPTHSGPRPAPEEGPCRPATVTPRPRWARPSPDASDSRATTFGSATGRDSPGTTTC